MQWHKDKGLLGCPVGCGTRLLPETLCARVIVGVCLLWIGIIPAHDQISVWLGKST